MFNPFRYLYIAPHGLASGYHSSYIGLQFKSLAGWPGHSTWMRGDMYIHEISEIECHCTVSLEVTGRTWHRITTSPMSVPSVLTTTLRVSFCHKHAVRYLGNYITQLPFYNSQIYLLTTKLPNLPSQVLGSVCVRWRPCLVVQMAVREMWLLIHSAFRPRLVVWLLDKRGKCNLWLIDRLHHTGHPEVLHRLRRPSQTPPSF